PVTVLLALTGLGLPAAIVEIAAVAGLGAAGVLALLEVRSARRHARLKAVTAALNRYGPRFAILFSGKPEAAYQIAMWLPYLERAGERYVLIVRERSFVPTARTLSGSPVVYAGSVESLERLLVPGIGAVFYVNNEMKNVQGVRIAGPTHVHLGHGDSDKPPSYSPTTAMFDEIFVAGRAGVDRFAAHGVLVPEQKFRVVGRPQAERVAAARQPMPDPPTVLYAPTWRGGLVDMGFGSLRMGGAIVAALLRRGATVIFRPHPYSYRDAESRVLIQAIDEQLARGAGHLGSQASAQLDIVDCFNRADALVTDVSSVASDFLRSGKPFAITDTGVATVPLAEAFPLAAAGYPIRPDDDLDEAVRPMFEDDPLAAERDRMRRYYLGDLPDDGYADVFVGAVRDAIARGTRA
ncbi:MAG: CDP-glycerol glycerophosphotransferase family protein, partial [Micropruina sp.]|uniref:CDP-glycerol glycerophosphotransferase family protein n=1 Tax=Micropruina sp. TaxID=2737536 RepID=UPI0039E2AC6E